MCNYSIFTHGSFGSEKDKRDSCRGEDSMRQLYADLRKHAIEITDCKK